MSKGMWGTRRRKELVYESKLHKNIQHFIYLSVTLCARRFCSLFQKDLKKQENSLHEKVSDKAVGSFTKCQFARKLKVKHIKPTADV